MAGPPGMEKLSLCNIERQHFLSNAWTLYCDFPSGKKTTSQTWASSIRQVATVETLEQFFTLFQDAMPRISTLSSGSSLHFFKDKIEPEWEHPGNKGGGRWTLMMGLSHMSQLDQLWQNTLLALIGNECGFSENICGVIIGMKPKQIKLSVWVKQGRNEKSVMTIGEFIKSYIGFEFSTLHMDFQAHPDPENPSLSEKSLYHI